MVTCLMTLQCWLIRPHYWSVRWMEVPLLKLAGSKTVNPSPQTTHTDFCPMAGHCRWETNQLWCNSEQWKVIFNIYKIFTYFLFYRFLMHRWQIQDAMCVWLKTLLEQQRNPLTSMCMVSLYLSKTFISSLCTVPRGLLQFVFNLCIAFKLCFLSVHALPGN